MVSESADRACTSVAVLLKLVKQVQISETETAIEIRLDPSFMMGTITTAAMSSACRFHSASRLVKPDS